MTIYTIIGIYLMLMLLVGWLSYRVADKTPEDYFLANRGMGVLVMFFTFVATNFSAFFFVGFSGAGYRIGYSYYAMMAFGTAFAALSFYFVGYKTWKLGRKHRYVTAPELIKERSGSQTLKVLYLLVMVLFTLPYLALQPIGAGYLLHNITGGEVTYFTGAVVLTLFIVLYVFMGGMRSVAITDVLQGVMMFGLMGVALWLIAAELGGIAEANRKVFALRPDLFSRQGGEGYFTPQKWFSLMILWMLCVPVFPHMFMRFFISRDARTLKLATVLYAFVPLLLFLLPVMIGIFGHLDYPGLNGKQADEILPILLMKYTPEWFAALMMVGALAAFMSTLDSQLLALSTMLTRDVYLPLFRRGASMQHQVWVGRMLIAGCAFIGLAIAYYPPDTIFDIAKHTFTGYAVLLPATIAILHFKRIPVGGCIASVVLGELLFVITLTEWLPRTFFFGFDPVVPVILLCVACVGAGWLAANIQED